MDRTTKIIFYSILAAIAIYAIYVLFQQPKEGDGCRFKTAEGKIHTGKIINGRCI